MHPELTGREVDLVIYSSRTSWVKSRLLGSTGLSLSGDAILGGGFVFCQPNLLFYMTELLWMVQISVGCLNWLIIRYPSRERDKGLKIILSEGQNGRKTNTKRIMPVCHRNLG